MPIYHQDNLRDYTEQQLVADLNFATEYLEDVVVEIMHRRKRRLHDLARARLHRLQGATIRGEMVNG